MKLNDIKLAAFLRLIHPTSFRGIVREDKGRVGFVFDDTQENEEIIESYLRGETFNFSPQQYGLQLDGCKSLIFENHKM